MPYVNTSLKISETLCKGHEDLIDVTIFNTYNYNNNRYIKNYQTQNENVCYD